MAPFFLLFFSLLAAATGSRRILHEPLYPIQWIPPPPPYNDSSSLPDAPKPPFLYHDKHQRISSSNKVAIAVSVSVCAGAILSLFSFFLCRRLGRIPLEKRKLIGDSRHFAAPASEHPVAASDFIYLGTLDPTIPTSQQLNAESNGSPCRKLSLESEMVAEIRHPSPELQPLPPLRHHHSSPPSAAAMEAFSDDGTYYTPKLSASRNGESPGSPRSVRSQRSSTAGKEISRSRRSSPRMKLTEYSSSDIKRQISPNTSPSPPPPPPPPPLRPPPRLLLRTENITKFSSPSIHPNLNEAEESRSPPMLPSRRQLLRPLPPEDAARADIQSSINTRHVNKNCSSSSNRDDEGDDLEIDGKIRLKPFHWNKVRVSSDRSMVWDQLKSDSFQLNEDMIETLFVKSSKPRQLTEQSRRAVLPSSLKQEERVLDLKKAQNIAILLRALNVTREEVSESLLDGNTEGLGAELFETLVRMAPSKEEEQKLRDFTGDSTKLGPAELFLKAILDIPFAFKRVDAMLYKANFEAEVNYLRTSFKTLEAACEDIKSSRMFHKLVEAVLRTGNRMYVSTNRGEAKALKLDALSKLSDIKGTDGKTTVLHFVVQEIIPSAGLLACEAVVKNHPSKSMEDVDLKKKGLKVIAGLSNELDNIKKAARMDTNVLKSYLSKLELGLEKIQAVLQLGESCEQGQNFFDSMRAFLQKGNEEISMIKSEEERAMLRIRAMTEYFQGDMAMEEAHPLRIFMLVRDFLSGLDLVCRDIGRLQDREMMGSAKSFRLAATQSLPVLHRYLPNSTANFDEVG